MAIRASVLVAFVALGACTGDTEADTGTETNQEPVENNNETGNVNETGTDTGMPDDVAKADGDTLDDPLFYQTFLGSGAPDEFLSSDAISAPPGDPEDWVGFTTPAPQNSDVNITFELTCTGSDNITMQLWDDEGASTMPLGGSESVNCAVGKKTILLDVNHDYLARIAYPNGAEPADYTAWTLLISW